jgi:hypothetical protein
MIILFRRQQEDALLSLCKVPDVFARLQPHLDLLDSSFMKDPNTNFNEILPVGTALIHADGQTYMTKVIRAF